MAEKKVTIYATAPSQKGGGDGVYKVGEKVILPKPEAGKLLATGRFTEDEDKAKDAVKKAEARKEALAPQTTAKK